MENARSAGHATLLVLVAAASAPLFSRAQPPTPQGPDFNAFYQIGPDSLPHEGVPKGEVRGPFVLPRQAYPGTQHTRSWLRCCAGSGGKRSRYHRMV
jgi:hypothetical protein